MVSKTNALSIRPQGQVTLITPPDPRYDTVAVSKNQFQPGGLSHRASSLTAVRLHCDRARARVWRGSRTGQAGPGVQTMDPVRSLLLCGALNDELIVVLQRSRGSRDSIAGACHAHHASHATAARGPQSHVCFSLCVLAVFLIPTGSSMHGWGPLPHAARA